MDAERRPKKDIAVLASVSRPTVDLWVDGTNEGVGGLLDRPRGAGREQVPPVIRARILAATPVHRSSRVVALVEPGDGRVHQPHRECECVASLRGEAVAGNGLRPQQQGTFKVCRDPRFAEKVADIVGLYLDPPGGAVVLSIDEKTQVQALDRTQPLLPMTST